MMRLDEIAKPAIYAVDQSIRNAKIRLQGIKRIEDGWALMVYANAGIEPFSVLYDRSDRPGGRPRLILYKNEEDVRLGGQPVRQLTGAEAYALFYGEKELFKAKLKYPIKEDTQGPLPDDLEERSKERLRRLNKRTGGNY